MYWPRIPFTLTFHPYNHAVKSIILKNFKLLQNDPDTGRIFSQPPLISFKRDQNIGNFLVRSAFKTSEQPGTFKCARARCKTCPFIYNVEKLSGPKRSIKITDHFTCTSANKTIKTLLNRLLDTLICLIILSNIWRSAASPYIKEAQKAAKLLNKDLFFKSALLILTVSTNAFHSTNSFCCFSRCQAPTNSVAPHFCI